MTPKMLLLFVANSHCGCMSTAFFFFSSRRRHTRFKCDWSSDVCSSVLSRRRHTRFTSELQSHLNLVCRLLLEKNKLAVCLPLTLIPPVPLSVVHKTKFKHTSSRIFIPEPSVVHPCTTAYITHNSNRDTT